MGGGRQAHARDSASHKEGGQEEEAAEGEEIAIAAAKGFRAARQSGRETTSRQKKIGSDFGPSPRVVFDGSVLIQCYGKRSTGAYPMDLPSI